MSEMKKLIAKDMQSEDIVKQNIEKLKGLFPEVFSEDKIKFEQLEELLGNYVNQDEDHYNFTWHGKRKAGRLAQTPSTGTLRPAKDESVDFDNTKNLFIEGDNLEVLKLLQKSYHRKVKMIYIDPPYNTGNDFVYEDDFKDGVKHYLEMTGQTDDEGKKLGTNSNSAGRYHTNWLNMMYPRLKLARNLMCDDGVIFISIDDNEQVNLKKLCDEIFGENNFIAQIIRNTNSSKNQSLFVSVSHEYCLVYAKNIESLKIKHSEDKWSVPKNNVNEYVKRVKQMQKEGLENDKITEELKILTNYPRFIDFTNYWYFDNRGLYRKDNLGGVKNGNMEAILNPLTGENDAIPPGGYRYHREKIDDLIKEDRIHFHLDGSLPTIKRYLHENMEQRPKSIMSDDQRPDYSIMKEFETPFDNPKQLSFMKRICSLGSNNSLILDFFAGSSTTAHAVMQLNAEDGGDRKCISVQLPELADEKSEAFKAGYKNIAEISKERIRRASKKIKEENPDYQGDLGFKVFKLDSSNIKRWEAGFDSLKEDLIASVDYIKNDRSNDDIVFEILLKYGLDLTLPIETRNIAGKEIHIIGLGALIICLDDGINMEVVNGICALKEELSPEIMRVVFKDNGFRDDVIKTNAITTLRRSGIEDIKSL